MTILTTLLGLMGGVGLAVAVYPVILQRRAKRMISRCSADGNLLGDPTSNYLSLLMYQTTQVFVQSQQGMTEESHANLVSILAGYASFLTMKKNRSESEQGTLDAIRCACNNSDRLRSAVDEQVNTVTGKSIAHILDELETELANTNLEPISKS